jgi:indolepyruvate ferredoxin oxidoreductase
MSESLISSSVAAKPPLNATLNDRYTQRSGRIVISGVQALVRLVLLQAARDKLSGISTGGFVSGYRGSPLGTLDMAFSSVGTMLQEHNIVLRPAVNEELGATAIAGSQQITQTVGAKVDGIFSLWYGKGPGLDRASDAIRHGNYQGASRLGGVVLAVGDDHIAKSSSIVCYSDEVVAGLQVPLFYPADAHEIVEYGLHAFAMSRHTGSWTALKIITEVADATRTVETNELVSSPVLPEISEPSMGLYNRWPEMPLDQEIRQIGYRLPAVSSYVYANGLDKIFGKNGISRFGLVAAGKSWLDLREALELLDLDESRLAALGITLYKPAMTWPLESRRLGEFAEGLDAILVVEEKGSFIERQIKERLYGSSSKAAVWGKSRPNGQPLLSSTGDLTPEAIAAAVSDFLQSVDGCDKIKNIVPILSAMPVDEQALTTTAAIRKPFFCSGCPHNRSTVLPKGSRATAGIGCHGLAAYNRPATSSFAQMGGEGVHWMGLAPFTNEAHIFANMGDGTYFHSGLLAIRQAVAAKLNITYKLLYNSAVAMTGGQSVDGELSVSQLVDQLLAEGVETIVISTDDLDRYANDPVRSRVARIEHRDGLEALQLELREKIGVSVIIYDQVCATEKRRLRKRGKLADPLSRVFINESVCEGCGDCSVKSNCLSVEPVQTPFGSKRRINQSSCNKDYSCLTGFCPSFVALEGARLRKRSVNQVGKLAALVPPPPLPVGAHDRILAAGIGGTGVVTIGAILVMASHIAGRNAAVLDQIGMAQKGGAVTSHIHIASQPIHALRTVSGRADLVLACDQIVGNSKDVMAAIETGRTRVVANADISITGDFTQNRNAQPDASLLTRRLALRAGSDNFVALPFTRLAEALLGDAIGSNLMMLGFAYQRGWARIELPAFEQALALNGVAVDMNMAAFDWGRHLALDSKGVLEAAGIAKSDPETEPLDQLIKRFTEFLADYQDERYAQRFRKTIDKVRAGEAPVSKTLELTRAAAHSLFRLMAYKDEYEVARLFTDGKFQSSLEEQFEGPAKISFYLSPPLIARRDKATGLPKKMRFGSWIIPVFRVLAKLRGLRGTPFDPFGYTLERKTERELIVDYEQLLDCLLSGLTTTNLGDAVEIAALPMEVRGYGHVKHAAIQDYRNARSVRLAEYDGEKVRALRPASPLPAVG